MKIKKMSTKLYWSPRELKTNAFVTVIYDNDYIRQFKLKFDGEDMEEIAIKAIEGYVFLDNMIHEILEEEDDGEDKEDN